MSNTEPLEIIKKLLKTDENLDFMLELSEGDLKTLLVGIRGRIDQLENNH